VGSLLTLLRFIAAFIGWIFGFLLGVALLEVSRINEVDNRVIVVLLLATACGILGFLGVEYVTVRPARWLIARIRESSAADLIAGSAGAGVGLVLGLFLAFPIALLPGSVGQFAPLVVAAFLGVTGAAAGILKKDDGISFLREIRQGRARQSREQLLLDTSVIIDGRIADIARAGFLHGMLLIPRFILLELQGIADSSDALRRARGRRGLDLLARLQKEALLPVQVIDRDPEGSTEVDAKLVILARELNCPILTNDYNLNRVAELQGVRVLNVNELATAVRPVVLPGEELSVKLIQEGKEAAQGVGYLEDGTMIVVEGGARHLGEEIAVVVLRVLQTVAGRMIFAQPRGDGGAVTRPRAVR
jgi:uncharacterized protein YacL